MIIIVSLFLTAIHERRLTRVSVPPVEANTDAFVTYLTTEWKKLRPQDWQTQTLITSSRSLTSTKTSSTLSSSSSKPKASKPTDFSTSPKKPLAVKDINLVASQAFKAVDNKLTTKKSTRAASPTDSETTLVDEYETGNVVTGVDATLDSLSAITDSSTLGPLRNSIKSSPDPPTPPKGFFTKSKSLLKKKKKAVDITVPTSPRKAIANAKKRKLAIASFDLDTEGYTTAVDTEIEQEEEEDDSDDDTITVVSSISTPPRKRNKTTPELSPRKTRSSSTATAKKVALQVFNERERVAGTKRRVSLRDSTLKKGINQSRMVQARREKEEHALRLAREAEEAEEKEREKKETARRNINDFIMQNKKKQKVEISTNKASSSLRKIRHVRTPSLEV